ncbi:MAG TPA: peptidoglycan DD-metalloendopeptidase family protein [Candidatus Pseudogracilibacillus intestinigallinarum]|uniref:Peptidoglycan DD-metalloendopeptidase family protein n=1 Tax=Candidatus Pseudogracilibacillus intestinigallinarum TaxID=2838742 RepID=A0A9D1PMR2_9BACI|nr:peptidoglycan DD-metalloendopeptidase family protein [Candidatus Pseudogracilibacillus intestinigallinarum]
MKYIKLFLAVAILFAGTVLYPTNDIAAEKIEDIQKDRENIKKDLKKANKEIKKLVKEIKELNIEIKEYKETLKQNEKAMKETKKEIKKVEEEIEKLEEEIEKRFDILKERAKSIQSNGGDIQYIEILFGAEDFNDFISRASAVNTIAESDASLIEDLEKDKAKVEKKLAQLEDLEQELKQIKQNTEMQKELTEEKKEKIKKKEAKFKAKTKKLKLEDKELASLEAEKEAENIGTSFSVDTANSNSTLGWPTDGGYISSHVGERWGAMHKGIDIARTDRSTSPPIYAAEAGTVESAGMNSGGYGNMVIVDHGNGLKTLYAHMSKITVKSGQKVKRGEQIGVMGTTGDSTGIHLHFEVHNNGNITNPTTFLR